MSTTVYATQDTYTLADSQYDNFEGLDLLVNGEPHQAYSYIEFDLSSFAGKEITEAMIKLFIIVNNLTSTSDQDIRFYRIDQSWDASEATFNEPPHVTDHNAKRKTLGDTDINWEGWNITDLVKDIISSGGYGIRVEIDADVYPGVWFSSIDGGNCPKLVITEAPTTCSQSFTASADTGTLPFNPYFNLYTGTTFVGQYQTPKNLTLDLGDTYMAEPLVPDGQEENWTAPDNVTFVACTTAIDFVYTAIEVSVTCTDPTPNHGTGCLLLINYDADNDGIISQAELFSAADAIGTTLTLEEYYFVEAAYNAGSINALCEGCYTPPVTCGGQCPLFDGTGCALLNHYDADNDGIISTDELQAANTDYADGLITQAELFFVVDAINAGSINALCEGCYVTCPDPSVSDLIWNRSPALVNQEISFWSTSSAGEGETISSYDWDWGDGSTHGTGATPYHYYTTAGTYDVTLIVTNSCGKTASRTESITIVEPLPPVTTPVISSIGTDDPPKLCEPIQFLNVVEWNDAGGTGTQKAYWQYTKDTAEYTGCGDELSWTQFSTEQWPEHTFTETDADITHIRCIVENKHGNRACAMIENFSMESTDGFTITVDPALVGKPLIVWHAVKMPWIVLPNVPDPNEFFSAFAWVRGTWNSADPNTVYKVGTGDIRENVSPPFDEMSLGTLFDGNMRDGYDCVILARDSTTLMEFGIFKGEDVFKIHSGSPTCVNLVTASNDVITEAVMGPVCDFFGIPQGTECEAFWAEFYDPIFIANYVSILQTGKDTLGNERELGAFDHIALPFAVLGSLPVLSMLPFGVIISKGLNIFTKTGIKLSDDAIQFTLDFSMDAANKISTKDTWYFLDAMGQVTEQHAADILAEMVSGNLDEAGILLRTYAGESKGWWNYHTLDDLLRDAMPEGAYNWLRTQIGLPAIGAGTVTNTAKQATLSADDIAKLADAALDTGVMDEATSAMYNSIKNLDAASVTKIDELKNVLRNSPELSAKLIAKHKSILDNVAAGGSITGDEMLTMLNHADIDPANIAGLVKSLDNPALVVKNLSDGTGAQALGNFIDATKKWYDTIVTQIDVTKADSWVKNNAVFARKALDSAEPAKMADIPHAAQEIASNQGKLVDDMCGGHVEPCFTETSDLIFGGGKTAADEVIAATDEFVDEATGNWFTKGKAYSKARYAKANVWYDGLSKENKERVAHAMVVAGMFFVVTVIYAIYKLTDADDVSPAYELKANIMEESYWVCEHASTAGSFDGLVVALVIFREDVMAAAKWCEDNEAALEGEETYEEFVRLVKLRMVEIIIFEARLEELGSTGVINCTSNTTFFYVDLDGKAAGFAYNTQMVQLKGIPVGSHTVKIRKHGYIPESCSKSINVTEGDPKGFDCQMTKIGDCSPVADASIYITPLSPIEDESIAFNGSADSDDPIETWEWDYGDGSPKVFGQAVTHKYTKADTYLAKLVVTNDCGESDSATRAIVVTEEEEEESGTLLVKKPIDAVTKQECDRAWEAEIYVDGQTIGKTTPFSIPFGTNRYVGGDGGPCGTHTITVILSGYDTVSKTVTINDGDTKSWQPEMYPEGATPDVGNILCETTPVGAAIWIVGSYRGDTNATIVDLPAGATVVTFKKTGYDDCVKTVTVVKDSTVTASCTLVAEAAEHDISFVVPDGATLYVDNELIETTTIARLSTILRGLRR